MYKSSNESTEPLNFLYEIIDKLIRNDINFDINLNYNDGFIFLHTQMIPKETSDLNYGEFIRTLREELKNESESDN